ncbi:MAG: NAD(P)-binding protein [Burkholderiales bacterium]|nr:NAD(P)-binding protein [Burkholderiales bacterium]
MRRREFLAAGAAACAAVACGRKAAPLPPGTLSGTAHRVGHLLRDGTIDAGPAELRKRAVVIVGGGIAGLSAAWRLRLAGFDDFEILELEDAAGGNARWGENPVSRYPLGAHYLPLPTRESRAVRLLLAELGVLRGDPDAPAPAYDERALCFAPQERLYRDGLWREGFEPLAGASARDRDEWRRFHDRMAAFKAARGADGRRAFAIPMALSSRDPRFLALDRLSMRDWLAGEGYAAEAVHWLANYACRDDFGCDYREVSAWAGIHYFACRDAQARDADPDAVLTWPEGNGWIVRGLLARVAPPLTAGALVHRVVEGEREVALGVHLARERRALEIRAEHVVWAAQLRFAARALAGADAGLVAALAEFDHAPWLVANLTLAEPPWERHGAPLAWDNVLYESPGLGYVVATHQDLASRRGPTVITYYEPLTGTPTAAARERLLATSREAWAARVLADLGRPHPELARITERVDVFTNGHAMVRPRTGFVWGDARERVLRHAGRVHFAHSDVSGFSLFEEAQYRGVAAAERVLARLAIRDGTVL